MLTKIGHSILATFGTLYVLYLAICIFGGIAGQMQKHGFIGLFMPHAW